MNRDSIIYSSSRWLFSGFFLIIGICLAFIPVILFIAALSETSSGIEQTTSVTILPDAKGVPNLSEQPQFF